MKTEISVQKSLNENLSLTLRPRLIVPATYRMVDAADSENHFTKNLSGPNVKQPKFKNLLILYPRNGLKGLL